MAKRVLPSRDIQQAISRAVHDAIFADLGDKAWKKCHIYAAVGSIVATEVTKQPYELFAGKIDLGSPEQNGYILDPAFHPEEWHAWFAAPWSR